MANFASSILARLKNESKKKGVSLQQIINLFCQEEFIRRLSKSTYKDNVILKGGFLLYSISNFTGRPTIDADFLLINYSNDLDRIKKLVDEVISSSNKNEFVELNIKNLEVIGELKKNIMELELIL